VAKVRINGETFEFDRVRKPLAEMMALEKVLGIPYGQWEADLQAGSARALAGFVWLVWRREGRDVAFSAIESGEVEIDYNSIEFEKDDDQKPDDGVDPTPGTPGPSTASTSSAPGPAAGSSPSAVSASGRGKSGS
jgi:hypothetical protein